MGIYIKQSYQKRSVIYFLFLLSALFLAAQANSSDSAPTLLKGEGLLLLDLQVNAPSAVMILQSKSNKKFYITLMPNEGRWLVNALPKGEYQIMEVKVPYFDLPYRKETGGNLGWRIKIQEGKLNYAGRLEVEKERTKNYVEIKKINRLITDLPTIQNELTFILSVYPLVDAYYFRDDFTSELLVKEVGHE